MLTEEQRTLLDLVPAPIYLITASGHVLFANRRLYEFTGVPDGAVLAEAWHAVIHPDDLAPLRAALTQGLAGVRSFDVPLRIRDAQGGFRHYRSAIYPFRREGERVVVWIGIDTDREDELRIIEHLGAAEQHLQTVLDSMPMIVWTADATGWIDWYNTQWYRFTGQTPEEAAGWGWQAAHHPDDFPRVMVEWPDLIRRGVPGEMEFRLRRADGVFRWMLTRIQPLFDDAETLVRWIGSTVDIDDQKRTEQRSRRVASLLQEALLPERLPEFRSLTIDALYRPAESDALVGGDWYDAVDLGDGKLLVSCGDVTGHGLEAAATAFRVRQAIAFAGRERPDPSSILQRVNAVMVAENAPLATAVVAVVDAVRGYIDIALAGHPPPVVANPNGSGFALPADGLPLGVERSFSAITRRVALEEDAVVVFYTDGLTEFARDPLGAEAALIIAAETVAAKAGVSAAAEAVRGFVMQDAEPRDDIVVLLLQMSSVDARPDVPNVPLTRKWRFHSSHALSAHTARREVGAYLTQLARPGEPVLEAELVIGEVLANTVEHAPGLVDVSVDWRMERPFLRIRDSGRGDGLPAPHLPDPLSEDGRGLFLLYALADDVAITGTPSVGTEIACRLRLRRTAPR
jgi:PAS domain S-box-containing protein